MESKEKTKFTLKGALPGLSPKIAFLIAGCLGGCLLLLRIYQTTALIDPATGFFMDRNHFTILPFYILSVVFAVGTLLLFYLGRQLPVSGLSLQRNIPHGIALLLTAGCVAYDAAVQYAAYTTRSFPETLHGSSDTAIRKVFLAYVVFAALAAVVFLLDGVGFLTGAKLGGKLRILRLVPVLWTFFRTIRFFAVTASYLHATQLFLTIFATAFLMLFLFEYAKKLAAVQPEENTAVYCATGLIAGTLLLTVGITGLLLRLTGKGDLPYCDFAPYTIAAGLFCLTALTLLRQAPRTAAEDEIPTAPLSEEA